MQGFHKVKPRAEVNQWGGSYYGRFDRSMTNFLNKVDNNIVTNALT